MKEREEVNGAEPMSSEETKSIELNKVEDEKKSIEGESVEVDKEEKENKEEKDVVDNTTEDAKKDVVKNDSSKKPIDEPKESKAKESKPKENKTKEDKGEIAHEEVHEHGHEDELANENFEAYSKEQLVDLIKTLAKHENPLYAERYLRKINPFFENIRKAEIETARAKYIKEGGEEDGFSFKSDELTNRFDANSRLIHDRKHSFQKDREQQRQANLKKAEETLEKLRLFVDSEESSTSFNKFKEIQLEWKAIGDVPGQFSKSLWANYNALVSRFYDQRSIYFELKELDRKKNYEAKVHLCERAEELVDFDNLKEAIGLLNELHYEYKHLGPVPESLQEELWVRFKGASDKVYHRRKEFVAELKSELHENLLKKEELVEQIKAFVEFDSDRIKEWNSKTKELLELQKKWESIGGLPREKSKEINRAFWSSFKTFFHNKGEFFKKLDGERKVNLDIKLKLVEKAVALKDSTDWLNTANEFKKLQQEWKSIGPVPERERNEVYGKFKSACDYFFDNKRSNLKEEEKNYKGNLKHKQEIIQQIIEWASDSDQHINDLKEKALEFTNAGYVPRKDIASIKAKFSSALDTFMKGLSISEDEKNTLRLEVELGDILVSKNSDRVLYNKEQNLRKQIHQIENDVALWRNNLEFFANSKNADGLRKEVNEKIEKAESRLAALKGQLKVLSSV